MPSGGKNIIKDKPSSFHIPLHQAELKEIDDQLKQNPSEDARNQLIERSKQIYNDIEKWFADNLDPVKEQAVREKQELFNAYLIEEWSIEANIEELKKTFPLVTVGYDYVSNALEVTIETSMFKDGNIKLYIEKIRSIIGDEIDLTLAPREYPRQNSCDGRTSNCDPIEGGVEFGVKLAGGYQIPCSVGFKAIYNNQEGFVTTGRCFNYLNQKVVQPLFGEEIGEVIENFNSIATDCDCAFVISNRAVGNGKIYDLPDVSHVGYNTIGKAVTMSGATKGIQNGAIVGVDISSFFEGAGWVFGLIEATYFGKGGDSGAPIVSRYANPLTTKYELLGIHEGSNLFSKGHPDARSWYTRRSKYETNFSNFSWGF